jgi:hypothetical protein
MSGFEYKSFAHSPLASRLEAGSQIGAGQAKVLVLVCAVVVVLQSVSLSFVRGDDRAPDFQAQSVQTTTSSPFALQSVSTPARCIAMVMSSKSMAP